MTKVRVYINVGYIYRAQTVSHLQPKRSAALATAEFQDVQLQGEENSPASL